MANGTLTHYNTFWVKALSKLLDLSNGGDKLKIALANSSYTPERDAHEFFDDLTNEVTGTAYTAGGLLLASQSIAVDNPNDRAIFDAADPVWAAATLTFQYAILYAHFVTSIRSATYQWDAGGGGTDEFYVQLNGGGDPSLSAPGGVDANDLALTEGTVDSLAVGEWDYGDSDALGFSTIYVRLLDGADPDTKAAGYVAFFDPAADPLIAYIDFLADQVYSAQNVTINWSTTGIFGAGGV